MTAKLFEVRDIATFIPMLAIKLDPSCEAERYLLARSGYGTTKEVQSKYVLLCQITGGLGRCTSDPYEWNTITRTYPEAHKSIIKSFDDLESGAVVDVQFILGERDAPKVSESRLRGDA
jgi:hypothetical protein